MSDVELMTLCTTLYEVNAWLGQLLYAQKIINFIMSVLVIPVNCKHVDKKPKEKCGNY